MSVLAVNLFAKIKGIVQYEERMNVYTLWLK